MFNRKVSLIVPFYNEKKKIINTLKILFQQLSMPDEIIFVNNSSTDNSDLKLRLFLTNLNLNINKKIKIINNKKRLPSISKNLAVKIAKHDYVIFFDVGLFVNKFFIYNIKNKIRCNKKFYIQGKYFFTSDNYMDRCLLMQTYGLKNFGDCIPSSCFHKFIFSKIGYFENFRSGYDRIWLKKLKSTKGINFSENFNSSVNYTKDISGNSFYLIFKKIFHYSFTSVGLKNYYLDKIYIFLIILFLCSILLDQFMVFLFIYFIFRSVVIPLKKNLNLKFKDLKIMDILYLPVMGLTIDAARSIGFIFGYLRKLK